jgi:hypothetical protein
MQHWPKRDESPPKTLPRTGSSGPNSPRFVPTSTVAPLVARVGFCSFLTPDDHADPDAISEIKQKLGEIVDVAHHSTDESRLLRDDVNRFKDRLLGGNFLILRRPNVRPSAPNKKKRTP